MQMVVLKFTNNDATPKVVEIACSLENCQPISAWYGAYHAGDRYTVTIDGQRMAKDKNGELLPIWRRDHPSAS